MNRDELAAMSDDARLSAGRAAAEAVGGRATGRLVGALRTPEIERGRILFALVPGGTFEMGFAADEMKTLLRVARLGPNVVGADHWRPIFERAYDSTRPTRSVALPAFLFARAPLLDGHVRAIDAALVTPEPFAEARRTTDAVATYVPLGAIARVLRSLGARVASDIEWEYVARGAGRSLSKAAWRDLHEPVAALHARPAFRDAHDAFMLRLKRQLIEDDVDGFEPEEVEANAEYELDSREALAQEWLCDRDESPLGIWGLQFGEWVQGGPTRGGAVLSYPWQDSCEVLYAHPAYRHVPHEGRRATVRPVLDLPAL